MEVVTIWFAGSATNRSNGCVRYVPGSHRIGPQKHIVNKDDRYILNSVDPGALNEASAVDALLEPGDISVHHPLILHGSERNLSEHWRRGGSIQYMPATTEITAKTWPSAFLVRGCAHGDINARHYLPQPVYVAGRHMPFEGCDRWSLESPGDS